MYILTSPGSQVSIKLQINKITTIDDNYYYYNSKNKEKCMGGKSYKDHYFN